MKKSQWHELRTAVASAIETLEKVEQRGRLPADVRQQVDQALSTLRGTIHKKLGQPYKFSDAQVAEMLEELKAGKSFTQIADARGMSRQSARSLLTNRAPDLVAAIRIGKVSQ